MGLGKLFARSVTQPEENRSAGAGFQVIIDNTPVNFPTSIYRGGMSVPGAWRAAMLISDLLGSVPWDAYRKRAGRPVERLDPTPPLLEQPSPPETRMTTMSSLALDLIWHGNAIEIVAARGADGYPTATVPVPAEWVGVRRVDQDNYWLPYGAIEYNIGGEKFSQYEVIHTKGPCPPGALRGFGVLEMHLSGALSLAMEQARQATSVSKHGVPTGTLKSDNPDLTEAEATALKTKWLQAQRERTVAVLNASTSFEALSWNPEELELVEARKFSLHEIALIFGLDPSWLGASEANKPYTNAELEGINLLKFTLGGHLARFEQTRSLAFPRGTIVKANLDAILRADTLTRYQAHKLGLDGGFLTVDEVRDMEDRPPMPASDNTDIPPAEEE